MLRTDLPKPVAFFRCGELNESHPDAHQAFEADFFCSITLVDFAVDATEKLWAFVGDSEAYEWQPAWTASDGQVQPGVWLDASG